MVMRALKGILIFLVFFCALLLRVHYIDQVGKDSETYKRAVLELLSEKNPYEWTIRSFTYGKDPWNHGFAYLPALLYVYAPLYILGVLITGLNYIILWKIPIILADLIIGVLLFQFLSRKNYYIGLLATAAWLFNPYLIFVENYTYADSLAILFMFLALLNLEEYDGTAGFFYALSVAFKTFPLLLFPIFLLKSKNTAKFIIGGLIVAIIISLPFMKSVEYFQTYVMGSLLVHGDRAMQGRPFFWYISYLTSLEFIRIIPLGVYSVLASFSGWIVTSVILISKKIKDTLISDKFVLSLISFSLFYAFTHVLNRTYLLWFMPILFVALSRLLKGNVAYYAVSVLAFYGFYAWYLIIWIDGFHITPLA